MRQQLNKATQLITFWKNIIIYIHKLPLKDTDTINFLFLDDWDIINYKKAQYNCKHQEKQSQQHRSRYQNSTAPDTCQQKNKTLQTEQN